MFFRVEADNNIETDEESIDGHRIYDDGPFLPSDLGKKIVQLATKEYT